MEDAFWGTLTPAGVPRLSIAQLTTLTESLVASLSSDIVLALSDYKLDELVLNPRVLRAVMQRSADTKAEEKVNKANARADQEQLLKEQAQASVAGLKRRFLTTVGVAFSEKVDGLLDGDQPVKTRRTTGVETYPNPSNIRPWTAFNLAKTVSR
jgi:hypothetical protein